MKVKILNIFRSTKDKNGSPLKTKDGREYERIGIKIDDDKYKDKWVTGFGNQTNERWEKGDEVELEIEEKGDFINFKTESPFAQLLKRVEFLEAFMLSNQKGDIGSLDASSEPPPEEPPF